jgi:hypothetical protein
MELEQLKTLWMEQDKKLDKSLQLNMQMLRKINFDKIAGETKTIFVYKILEMIVLLFMLSYLLDFTIKYFFVPQFSISAIITMAFIAAGFISDVRQISIIIQMRSDHNAPVSSMQKKVEKLKILIVNYVKTAFISIPFYPVLLVVSGKIFLNVDFASPHFRLYLLANVIFSLLLLPVFIWMYRQLSKQNISQVWVKNFLTGSGWNQAQSAQQFLEEIEAFENG